MMVQDGVTFAVSSLAASAWSGGGVDSNYHGAGRYAQSNVGMIAFGTVMGGAGSALTGGNFWEGAVTGLVVSGLNHFLHQDGGNEENPPNKRDGKSGILSNFTDHVPGEVFNFFDKNFDGNLYSLAEAYEAKENTITIFTHGGYDCIVGPDGVKIYDPNILKNYLIKNSRVYQGHLLNTNAALKIELKSCLTAFYKTGGFAAQFSRVMRNVQIIAIDSLMNSIQVKRSDGTSYYKEALFTYDFKGKSFTFLNGSVIK
jgi:hypothetical protein